MLHKGFQMTLHCYSSHCIRGLALATQPFQVRFRDAENLSDNKNRLRAQIKEIIRYAQTKFFNL